MIQMIDTKQTSNFNILVINLDGLRRDKVMNSDALKSLIELILKGLVV